MYYFGRVSNTVIFFPKWKLDKCVSFSLQKTVAWSAWLTFLVKALAPRLVCTTFKKRKKEDHPDEIQSTIFTDWKTNENRILIFFFEKPPQLLQKRTAVLMDLCLVNNKKRKTKKHDFDISCLLLEFFAIFSRITIKKQWTSDGDCQY